MIKKPNERTTKIYNSRLIQIITKEMLMQDMYELKLSQRQIASKYNTARSNIQNLQHYHNLEMLQLYERRVPKEFTYEQKQLILGCVFADGHIFRENSNRHGALKIVHTVKKFSYVDYKYNLLKRFVKTPPNIIISELNGKIHKCKTFRTLTHSFFTYLHENLYRKKEDNRYEKYINLNILNQVDSLGLAIMYMDDGTKHHSARDFCFECFSVNEQEIFGKWLNDKYGLEACIIKYRDSKFGYRTRILKKSVPKFIEIINPHIIDCMKYKI